LALTNAMLPYLQAVADEGFEGALHAHDDLRRGVYVYAGRVARPSLARAFGLATGAAGRSRHEGPGPTTAS
jgi:alanine dehydrogenase